MNSMDCDQLEDYLSRELPPERRAEFDRHLEVCEDCRSAVEDWNRLRTQLREATTRLEKPSEELLQRISEMRSATTVRRDESRQWYRVAMLIAACVVVGALLSTIRWTIPHPGGKESHPIVTTIIPTDEVKLPDDVIGVPIDIGDPDVTVVWVYRTNSSEVSTN